MLGPHSAIPRAPSGEAADRSPPHCLWRYRLRGPGHLQEPVSAVISQGPLLGSVITSGSTVEGAGQVWWWVPTKRVRDPVQAHPPSRKTPLAMSWQLVL